MSYRVEVTRQARNQIRKLLAEAARRVASALRDLEAGPFPRDAVKLSGIAPPLWRLRVGDYRIIYAVAVNAEVIFIEAVLRCGTQTYRRFER